MTPPVGNNRNLVNKVTTSVRKTKSVGTENKNGKRNSVDSDDYSETDDEEDTKHLQNARRMLLCLAMTDLVAFFPSHH